MHRLSYSEINKSRSEKCYDLEGVYVYSTCNIDNFGKFNSNTSKTGATCT